MHEYGLVRSLLSLVDEEVRANAGKRAIRVVVAIEGGHLDEPSLRAAFDTFKAESSARDAELIVSQAHAELWCPECGERATVAHRDPTCPVCGGAGVRLTPADEIYLQSVEIEV